MSRWGTRTDEKRQEKKGHVKITENICKWIKRMIEIWAKIKCEPTLNLSQNWFQCVRECMCVCVVCILCFSRNFRLCPLPSFATHSAICIATIAYCIARRLECASVWFEASGCGWKQPKWMGRVIREGHHGSRYITITIASSCEKKIPAMPIKKTPTARVNWEK